MSQVKFEAVSLVDVRDRSKIFPIIELAETAAYFFDFKLSICELDGAAFKKGDSFVGGKMFPDGF